MKKYYPLFFLESSESIITNQDKKDLIFNARNLKYQANNISTNYLNYKVAYHRDSDIQLYNICASMFHSILKLSSLEYKCYFQLKRINIIESIDNLVKNMPDFYDGRNDDYSMVFTITEFIRYFSDDKNKNEFIEYCDKIIEELDS